MSGYAGKPDLKLDARLMRIVDADYPRFSAAEMERRRKLLAEAMAKAGVDHLVAYSSLFRGGPVHWISDWYTTFEAVLVFSPGQRDSIAVQFFNHLPQARQVLPEVDFRWGGPSTIATAIGALKERGAKSGRVGAVGLVPMHYYKALGAEFGEVHDLNRPYFGLRMVKSAEEIDWYRIAARLSDLPIEALTRDVRAGLDERDLGAITEGAYTPWRGANLIHFFLSTSMHAPDAFVPRQHLTARKIRNGDVIVTEITASFWEQWGQVLRTFTVGEGFTPLYQRLHDTALAAYDAVFATLKPGVHFRELEIGRKVVEDAGLTFYDDLTHGLGGGYLPPVIGSPMRPYEPLPDMTLQPGMMLVIQPNVITPDQKAGVQTGELVVITDKGAESLHTAPRGAIHLR